MFANQQLIVLIRQKVVEGQYGLTSSPEVREMILYNENSYPDYWV